MQVTLPTDFLLAFPVPPSYPASRARPGRTFGPMPLAAPVETAIPDALVVAFAQQEMTLVN